MKYPNIPLAQSIIQLCKAKGIVHIVISPGSRNAPLTIGFTKDSFFKCYSVVDERCAAFFGLGIAQQTGHPVALVCTSGSALLNYYPAVAEAFYSETPLVVLSADRPKNLINIGDGQTINQKEVFSNHSLYSANLCEDDLENNDLEINKALNSAIISKGPVHVNVPFKEPLYNTTNDLLVNPIIRPPVLNKEVVDHGLLKKIALRWSSSKKKMILVGVNAPHSISKEWLNTLAKDDSVIVFTETTSNMNHPNFFPNIDKIISPLTSKEMEMLRPDILLTFGGLIVSKKIKAFLRKFQPKHHWHIDELKANNTFFCLEHHIKLSPNEFFDTIFQHSISTIISNYKPMLNNVKNDRSKKHDSYLKSVSFSDLKVFDIVINELPQDIILQLSNSATVRYAQLFDLDKSVEVFCNRGTSGIDGSTSTAIGCAVVSKKQTFLVTGDLSFFYDSNALWNNYIPNNFRIILINNSGGGIFRILPGKNDTKIFDTFFETKHNLTAKQLCKMFNMTYLTASTSNELQEAMSILKKDNKAPILLEIFTPSTINDQVLLDYFEFIA
ncbi:2-succinyl-5-enolpyruvyl-6-hydroxy-3-cyclohexene-1-carboxylic-acid synthase [Flavobacteriaceae bacterium]|jgi:2-succinyl-5-enolpyruvyl-6-hydroxy-3-cyclohexene-1-carboxylate synthase|nr:2-succinyl-5-enolpyruvyl-6-hydroxy-3-cyclohexene-1-carboxylic-acid synthase [Flavobacteriaceae bacterium]